LDGWDSRKHLIQVDFSMQTAQRPVVRAFFFFHVAYIVDGTKTAIPEKDNQQQWS
jgi:hypothetical protein